MDVPLRRLDATPVRCRWPEASSTLHRTVRSGPDFSSTSITCASTTPSKFTGPPPARTGHRAEQDFLDASTEYVDSLSQFDGWFGPAYVATHIDEAEAFIAAQDTAIREYPTVAWRPSYSGVTVSPGAGGMGRTHDGRCQTRGVSECRTCELVKRRDDGEAPPWDRIRRTPNWDVVHAFGTSVEGWIVLVVRRHITAVADMTADEAAELGPLVKEVSRAVQKSSTATRPTSSSSRSIRIIPTFTSMSSREPETSRMSIKVRVSSACSASPRMRPSRMSG